jgi:alpha-D-xyloside xylohydrolase
MVCLGADVFYDPTNPEARGYLFEKVKRNYMRHGIRCSGWTSPSRNTPPRF